MSAPLFSRRADPDELRSQIARLRKEIDGARATRDGAIKAIADRRQKLNRLEAQLAMTSSAPALSIPALCPA